MVQDTEKHTITPPPQTRVNIENIPIRVRHYHIRHPAPPYVQRRRTAWMLLQSFELSQAEIARLLKASPTTISADIRFMQTLTKRSRTERQAVADLLDYIIYNARYIR